MPKKKAAGKRPEPLLEAEKRCTYEGCHRPDESSKFYQILDANKRSGGQDWSALVGSVLCDTCYRRFKVRGTLDRCVKSPLTEAEKVCTYAGCGRPTNSSHYHYIEEARRAGGQDWSQLVGSVLCQACYDRFKNSGTLAKPPTERLTAEEKRCTYPDCPRRDESSHFYVIERDTKAGGQDWSSLVGNVLCASCYCRYKDRGTIEKNRRLVEGEEQQCQHSGCAKPRGSGAYHRIDKGTKAGKRDWSPFAGKILCQECYLAYRDTGSLVNGEGWAGSAGGGTGARGKGGRAAKKRRT